MFLGPSVCAFDPENEFQRASIWSVEVEGYLFHVPAPVLGVGGLSPPASVSG